MHWTQTGWGLSAGSKEYAVPPDKKTCKQHTLMLLRFLAETRPQNLQLWPTKIKLSLKSTTATDKEIKYVLAHTRHDKPFVQAVDCKKGYMTSVLMHKWGLKVETSGILFYMARSS